MTNETHVHFKLVRAGRKMLKDGAPTIPAPSLERVPRISRLMALAIHFDNLIRKEVIQDYADLARMGGLTRARVTQIMNLLNLAPEIQEKLLFLPNITAGREALTERGIRNLVSVSAWSEQKLANVD